jgi:TonB family protein
VSFLITAFVIQAAVVKTQEPETKPADKGEVADLLAKLRKSDQPVVETCLEGCDEAKPSNVQKVVGGQVVEKPAPEYPVIAKAAHASGDVVVQLIVDEEGKVIAAKAISGHPLLQAAAVAAERHATFTPGLGEWFPGQGVGDHYVPVRHRLNNPGIHRVVLTVKRKLVWGSCIPWSADAPQAALWELVLLIQVATSLQSQT